MKGIAAVLSLIIASIAILVFIFGDLPTIAVSTDIERVNERIESSENRLIIKIAANELFILDEAIDRLQRQIWDNIDRQQTYMDKNSVVPNNLREQLRGLDSSIKKLKKRRQKLE